MVDIVNYAVAVVVVVQLQLMMSMLLITLLLLLGVARWYCCWLYLLGFQN